MVNKPAARAAKCRIVDVLHMHGLKAEVAQEGPAFQHRAGTGYQKRQNKRRQTNDNARFLPREKTRGQKWQHDQRQIILRRRRKPRKHARPKSGFPGFRLAGRQPHGPEQGKHGPEGRGNVHRQKMRVLGMQGHDRQRERRQQPRASAPQALPNCKHGPDRADTHADSQPAAHQVHLRPLRIPDGHLFRHDFQTAKQGRQRVGEADQIELQRAVVVEMRQQAPREDIHRQRGRFQHPALIRVIRKIMRRRWQPPAQPRDSQGEGQQQNTHEKRVRAGQGSSEEFTHERYCTRS